MPVIALFYDLIIIKSILNLLTAVREWGSFAGIIIISPFFRRYGFPDMDISTSPSRI
jgi:hypothetical protein